MHIRISITIILWAGLLASVWANPVKVTPFNKSKGLSSNFTSEAVQDTDGFVWILTKRGVDRFDGTTFIHFPFAHFGEGTESLQLDLNHRHQVVALNNREQVFGFNKATQSFEVLFATGRSNHGLDYGLMVDANGVYWLSLDNQLMAYEYSTGTVVFRTELGSTIRKMVALDSQRILVATDYNLYPISVKQVEHPLIAEGLFDQRQQRIRCIEVDTANRKVWIGTHQAGLWLLHYANGGLTHMGAYAAFEKYPIVSILLHGQQIYLATAGAGLFELSTHGNLVQRYFEDSPSHPLTDNSIRAALWTTDSTLLLCNYRSGISIVSTVDQPFQRIYHKPEDPNSLQSNVVGAICEVSPNVIWFGHTRGVSEWNKNSNQWRHHVLDHSSRRSNNLVMSLYKVDHQIWIGSSFYPLGYAPSHAALPIQTIVPEEYMVRGIAYNNRSTLGFIGWPGKVKLYDLHTKLFKETELDYALVIKYDAGLQQFLVGTENGFYSLQTNDSGYKISPITEQYKGVKSFAILNDSLYALGTQDGLVIYSLSQGAIKHLGKQDGLSNHAIISVIEDNAQNLWVTTESKLYRINAGDYSIDFFDGIDHSLSINYSENSVYKDSEGIIYLGSNEGVVWFDPSRIEKQQRAQRFYITQFSVGLDKSYVNGNTTVSADNINTLASIQLPYDHNSISFSFANICFNPLVNTSFEWQLAGYNDDWRSSPDHKAIFTKIPPGQYTLMVRDIETKRVLKTLAIVIRPPWWSTWPAYLVYLLVVAVGVLLFYRYTKKRYQRGKAEEVMLFLMNTVHDIKTPLSLIQAPVEELLEHTGTDTDDYQKLLMIRQNAEKIQRFAVDILDMKKSNLSNGMVSNTVFDVAELIRIKAMSFEVMARQRGIMWEVQVPQDSVMMESDPNIIDRVLDNLLSNALKYCAKEAGVVRLHCKAGKRNVCIDISDNGIGIPAQQQPSLFSPFFRASNAWRSASNGTGLGLMIARNFVLMLKGELEVHSQEHLGTTIAIVLPLGAWEQKEAVVPNQVEPDPLLPDDAHRLLVVDNNPEFAEYVASRLRRKGYACAVAYNGKEALEAMYASPYDVVITDNDMPLISGLEFVKAAKSNPQTSHIPIIMLSALTSSEEMEQCLLHGAEVYLAKPVDVKLLLAAISSILDNRKRISQRLAEGGYAQREELYKNSLDNEFIQLATDTVLKHIEAPTFGVNELAQEMKLSHTALYNKMKSLTDLSPNEFVRTIRLSEGRKLLLDPRYKIAEVAYMVGFADAKYFSTCFRKQYGITPTEFIDSVLKSN